MLDKNSTLFDRDEKGVLIPKKVFVKELNESISIIPLTRGEIKKFYVETDNKDKDLDAEIVLTNCKNPQYTEEELKFVKPFVVEAIVKTILEASCIKPQMESVDVLDSETKKN